MTQPPESPQIIIRETSTPPRFAGLTLPSALRELCPRPENGTPMATPRGTEMSALATRLRKIQLDISPGEKGSRETALPVRLEFDEEDDKENTRKGTAVWGRHKELVKEGSGKDAFEEAAKKMNSRLPGNDFGHVVKGEGEEDGADGECSETEISSSPSPQVDNVESVISESGMTTDAAREEEPALLNEKTCVEQRQFKSNLQKILDGKSKWPWLERCKAMSSATEVLTNYLPSELRAHTNSVLPTLSSKLNDHLDELRPSVITSALGLVNAIVSLPLERGSKFAEEIFPSVLDLACGRSLTAQEAAKSLALLLANYSELEPVLEDADNIDRLCDILLNQSNSLTNADFRKRASSALRMAEKIRRGSESTEATPVQVAPFSLSKAAQTVTDTSPRFDDSAIARQDSPRVRAARLSARLSGKLAELSAQNQARRLNRSSVRLSDTSRGDNSFSDSPSSRVADTSIEIRNGATVIRNAKLRGSYRKSSPASMRKQKTYTEEEVEEQRRKATETASEDASKAHEKEKTELVKEKDELWRKLKREISQVDELKGVLEEYQLTMNTMVAQGNSKVSAQNNALVTEKNKLKGELLEVTNSFETLKEKYEDSKKTVELFEARENRYTDQIKELKRNMVELQKWSNDLKANTEKKLSKAFESVTSYRASYIDKEAHAKKAISDLQRTRAELEREQHSHAETAAKFAQVEAQLHSEQDARSSAEASLTTTKAALSRTTSEKDRLRSELDTAKDSLSETKSKLLEFETAASHASEIQGQLDSIVVENQSLKARAYDDMTKIKDLEATVKEKDSELEEMSAICEEAMERLERGRIGQS